MTNRKSKRGRATTQQPRTPNPQTQEFYVESIADGSAGRTRDVARPELRKGSGQSVIDRGKELVPALNLADSLLAGTGGSWRKVGKEWVTNCLIPDHQDRSPSFTVDPDKNVWFCHGCIRGGDVIELARLVWGHDRADTAAAELLLEFGHEIPPQPEGWHRRQSRQEKIRRAIEEAKVRRVQRRIYRWILAPPLANIEDEDERLEEVGHAWDEAGYIARLLVARVRGAR